MVFEIRSKFIANGKAAFEIDKAQDACLQVNIY